MSTEPQAPHDDPVTEPSTGQAGPDGAAAADETGSPVALPQHTLKRTRVGGVWTAIGCFAVVLLFLLIFILENSRTVEVSYFGAHGHLPLGVALLLAVVCGVLLIALPGAARIIQLRITARRHRRADARKAAATEPAGTAT